MSVTGVFSGIGNTQLAPLYRISSQEFQQLGQDLATGNLSGAQSDFAILQQALAPATSNAATSSSTANPLTQAFQQLSNDLNSGNLTGAQKDYTAIQQDLQNQFTGHLHHHHRFFQHPLEGPPTTLPGQPLSPPGEADNTAAQPQAILAQQLQQYALGNGSDAAAAGFMPDPVSFLA